VLFAFERHVHVAAASDGKAQVLNNLGGALLKAAGAQEGTVAEHSQGVGEAAHALGAAVRLAPTFYDAYMSESSAI
jgi:hypothetical protein